MPEPFSLNAHVGKNISWGLASQVDLWFLGISGEKEIKLLLGFCSKVWVIRSSYINNYIDYIGLSERTSCVLFTQRQWSQLVVSDSPTKPRGLPVWSWILEQVLSWCPLPSQGSSQPEDGTGSPAFHRIPLPAVHYKGSLHKDPEHKIILSKKKIKKRIFGQKDQINKKMVTWVGVGIGIIATAIRLWEVRQK